MINWTWDMLNSLEVFLKYICYNLQEIIQKSPYPNYRTVDHIDEQSNPTI